MVHLRQPVGSDQLLSANGLEWCIQMVLGGYRMRHETDVNGPQKRENDVRINLASPLVGANGGTISLPVACA